MTPSFLHNGTYYPRLAYWRDACCAGSAASLAALVGLIAVLGLVGGVYDIGDRSR